MRCGAVHSTDQIDEVSSAARRVEQESARMRYIPPHPNKPYEPTLYMTKPPGKRHYIAISLIVSGGSVIRRGVLSANDAVLDGLRAESKAANDR